jgi:hypothetical protein
VSRLLALLAGSALVGAFPVEVHEPPAVVAESIIANHAHWAGRVSAQSAGGLWQIAIAAGQG